MLRLPYLERSVLSSAVTIWLHRINCGFQELLMLQRRVHLRNASSGLQSKAQSGSIADQTESTEQMHAPRALGQQLSRC